MKFFSFCFLSLLSFASVNAQSITKPDGSPLQDRYCREDINYPIMGTPAGGTFDGCGVFKENGQWYFNPYQFTIEDTLFAITCPLTYTTDDGTRTVYLTVWKPVIIHPPLRDTFTCDGEIALEAYTFYVGAYDYVWSPGAPLVRSDTSITRGFITETTTFVVTATDRSSGCIGTDTIRIDKFPEPELDVHNDTIINVREQVELWATGATNYKWTPRDFLNRDDIADPLATPQRPTTYTVIGTNEFGCKDTAQVTIDMREKFLVPNAFSPNGDGINDVFRIENYGYQQLLDFSIFNRVGQLVFNTKDGTKGWDGTLNGKPAPQDTYFYIIRMSEWGSEARDIKGDVLLIR